MFKDEDLPVDRIVTLLPSATEIVCGLGLRDRLVGVTHECDYPASVQELPEVTRSSIDVDLSSSEIDSAVRKHLQTKSALYSIDKALLVSLRPELLITQALCNVCAVSETDVLEVLSELPGEPTLINLEPTTLREVFDTINLVGRAVGCVAKAKSYVTSLDERVNKVREAARLISTKPRVGFLEWLDPPFNGGHWTPELIEYAGGVDCFGNKYEPSQTIDHMTILASDPEILIISLCGFDEIRARQELEAVKRKFDYASLSAVRTDRVYVVDGNSFFSRPGPRLVDALELLFNLLHS